MNLTTITAGSQFVITKGACQLAMLKSNRATRSGFPAVQFKRLVEMILDRLLPPVSLKSFAMLAGLVTFWQGHVSSSASELPPCPGSAEMLSQTLKITGNTRYRNSCYGLPNRENACPCSGYTCAIMASKEGCWGKKRNGGESPWQLTISNISSTRGGYSSRGWLLWLFLCFAFYNWTSGSLMRVHFLDPCFYTL